MTGDQKFARGYYATLAAVQAATLLFNLVLVAPGVARGHWTAVLFHLALAASNYGLWRFSLRPRWRRLEREIRQEKHEEVLRRTVELERELNRELAAEQAVADLPHGTEAGFVMEVSRRMPPCPACASAYRAAQMRGVL